MKQRLNYGRISWSYEDFDPDSPCVPTPLVRFSPFRISTRMKTILLSDRHSLELLKLNTKNKLCLKEAYELWTRRNHFFDIELGEGRAFIKWLKQHHLSIKWSHNDYSLHQYFTYGSPPRHKPFDECALGHTFSVLPVLVKNRFIKLYLEDESVLSLFSIPYGKEENFIHLIEQYILLRFELDKWNAPAPLFIDWVRANGRKPLFYPQQLGFCF